MRSRRSRNGQKLPKTHFLIKKHFLLGRYRSEPPATRPSAAAADRGLGRRGMDLVKFGQAEAGLIRQKSPITNFTQ